jgi:hypothetical protein
VEKEMGWTASVSRKTCRRFIAGLIVALSLGLPLLTGCGSLKLAKAFVTIMQGNTTMLPGLPVTRAPRFPPISPSDDFS